MPRGIRKHPRGYYIPCTRCQTLTFRYPSTQSRSTFCTPDCHRAWYEETAIEHFWQRVLKTETCWEWQGPRIPGKWPYGRLKFRLNGQRLYMAHQVGLALKNGPIPEGLNVLHHCDNPPCVRDEHLFIGTDSDNAQDAIQKGRFYFHTFGRGEDSPFHKLTWEKVRKIRELYTQEEVSQNQLSKMFGVKQGTIHDIVRNKTWREQEKVSA